MPISELKNLGKKSAYAEFESRIHRPPSSEMSDLAKLIPHYVTIVPEADISLADQIRRIIEVPGRNSDFYILENELDLLATLEGANSYDGSIEFFIYVKNEDYDIEHELSVRVIKIGQMVEAKIVQNPKNKGNSLAVEPRGLSKLERNVVIPVNGIIDDGIGFLNARFCRLNGSKKLKSRFHSIWLQGRENYKFGETVDLRSGAVFTTDQKADASVRNLDDILEKMALGHVRESDLYRHLARELETENAQGQLGLGASHGTHVLDLFSGQDPKEAQDKTTPILFGVQIASRAVRQSNGALFELNFLQGLGWIVDATLKMINQKLKNEDAPDPNGKLFYPLVINASFGILAGSKTGEDFLTTQILAHAKRYEQMTDLLLGKPSPMRIVFPYGNSYASRQVAFAKLDESESSLELDWQIQPDDLTANYLELRTDAQADFQFLLRAPNGIEFEFDAGDLPGPGQAVDLRMETKGSFCGQVSCKEEGGRNSYLISLAPTRRETLHSPHWATIPCGIWVVSLKNLTPNRPLNASFQIQRDDTPKSYRSYGRQSAFGHEPLLFLDHQAGLTSSIWTFAPKLAYPITSEASHSARLPTGPRHSHVIYGVGAAVRTGYTLGKPASYSAMGSDNTALSLSTGPDGSALASINGTGFGRRASGTLSGSSAFFAGTSVASPIFARQVSKSLEETLSCCGETLHRDAELKEILGHGWNARKDPRLGHGTLGL